MAFIESYLLRARSSIDVDQQWMPAGDINRPGYEKLNLDVIITICGLHSVECLYHVILHQTE